MRGPQPEKAMLLGAFAITRVNVSNGRSVRSMLGSLMLWVAVFTVLFAPFRCYV
jgi:hypothetical protein